MKQLLKVKFCAHSVIDVITNSSTEIFVHSEHCIEPAKELLNELLYLEGSNKKCDDIFEISLEYDKSNIEEIFDYYVDNDEYPEISEIEDKNKFMNDILNGNIDAPGWYDFNFFRYHIQTHIVIKSKDEKYNNLLYLLEKLLYSPNYYEHSSN
jgi:hypothetical protein